MKIEKCACVTYRISDKPEPCKKDAGHGENGKYCAEHAAQIEAALKPFMKNQNKLS